MKKSILIFLVFAYAINSNAISFTDAVKKLRQHESIDVVKNISKATEFEADIKSSWGDPKFKITAKNFPVETLKNDQSPMTGLEFGIGQKIPLTSKYSNVEESLRSLSKSYQYDAQDKSEYLLKNFWEILITRRQMEDEKNILKENFSWLDKILKVSKKLYTNGKISQQALLDLQIRRSEIESLLNNKSYDLDKLNDNLNYLLQSESNVDIKSIPWRVLNTHHKKVVDNREKSLFQKLKSKELGLKASRLNYIPDMTVSIGYTKRENIDGLGDFVGASLSFPLPFSGEKYSGVDKAIHEKYSAKKSLDNYKRAKRRDISLLKKEISKLERDLHIISSKTIKFARNSRLITSKSYGIGNSTYVELLQSELKLQEILLKKTMLISNRDIQKITLKYVLGESLYE